MPLKYWTYLFLKYHNLKSELQKNERKYSILTRVTSCSLLFELLSAWRQRLHVVAELCLTRIYYYWFASAKSSFSTYALALHYCLFKTVSSVGRKCDRINGYGQPLRAGKIYAIVFNYLVMETLINLYFPVAFWIKIVVQVNSVSVRFMWILCHLTITVIFSVCVPVWLISALPSHELLPPAWRALLLSRFPY